MRPARMFAFRLAAQIGCTVRELLLRLDSRELTEWMAFDALEPIGGRRGDRNAAIVAATVANCHRGRRSRPYQVEDFMPRRAAAAAADAMPMDRAFAALMRAAGGNR